VYHAGSLDAAVSDLGPDFTATTGYVLAHVRGPSGALADQIRSDEIQPDVFHERRRGRERHADGSE